ncbi:DUF2157 domain-containing protein [Pseudomonas mangiferae]|uniref:DUF2157 domain-containing protein n=1 Tax=Pseudomonas mangiferae TaxID=2593654 RepID=A0A553H2J9_9PSED|nr:DUF2157 domain-containing protein [Pseudomonas mangiferae]TRX75974.1 DUF2157 domain-containing protein [Pseudomonas mangiferae]
MSLTLDPEDFARAVTAGVLQPGQDQALLAFFRQHPSARPSFQFAHVAYYFGALLIMGAMGWLLNRAWNGLGEGALLVVAVCYMVGFTAAGLRCWRRGLEIPGGLLGAVAVSLTPLAIYALERLTGFWPGLDFSSHDYYRYVHGVWLPMELGTVLVGVLMLRLMPFPFIVMPMALALWFFSMDFSEWVYGIDLDWTQRRWVSLWFGLAMLLGSLLVDGRSRRDYAFWGYLAGLLAFWGGLSLMDSDSELGKAAYCLINLLLIGAGVLLRRPMFAVFGALGVAGYLGHLSYRVFADSLAFPLVLTLIGLGLIALGVAYQKRRDRLTERLRTGLPASLVALLPALRR